MIDGDIKVLERDLTTSIQTSNIPKQLQLLNRLGKIYHFKKKYRQALNYFRKAIILVNTGVSNSHRSIALTNLGCVFWEMAQLGKAIDLFEEALILAKNNKDSLGQLMLLIILGISSWRKLEWEKALLQFELAFEAFPVRKSDLNLAKLDKEGTYEVLRKSLERGLDHLKKRVLMARDNQALNRILQSHFAMLPLIFFIGSKEELPNLYKEVTSLAQQLNQRDLIHIITKLNLLFGNPPDHLRRQSIFTVKS